MTGFTAAAPPTTGVHHFSPTVSDVEVSAEWYARVFGLERLPGVAPHHGDEDGGYAVLLLDRATGLLIGLHHHEGHHGGSFDERRSGLDHIAWGVRDRADLDIWAEWLDQLAVQHSGVIDKDARNYSAIVFRDPDGIQLELFHRHG
ncbi:VOC family protein [Pseudonocardia sp. 73-21]|uniref:VOC family protein n=1 Tax=Pseudonocardia sp. 73-21 TaxID=1895809 RepID=UPI0009607843|nr:VOC family protein [Pseudonocardia sp. 73-21]OJY53566.1 MAG: glyoxalase [Pseudonocardia sp. 73-21]